MRPVSIRSSLALLAAGLIGLAFACTSKGDNNGGTGPGGSIAISITPNNATVDPGGTATLTATLTRSGGFTGDVVFDAQGVPTGVTGAFTNITTNGNVTTATGTITVATTTTPGTYTITVRGTGSGVTAATTTFTLTVSAPPAYTLGVNPTALTIFQGANDVVHVSIGRTNYTGAVTLSLQGAPAGVTGTFNPTAPTDTASTLTLAVGAAVTPGQYTLTVQGTGAAPFIVGGGASAALVDHSAQVTLTVTTPPTPDYSLSLTQSSLSIQQSNNAPTTVNIARTNFTGAVTLGVTGAPTGVTASFNPAAPTGNTSTLTVTVGASVAAGVYNLTVTGAGTPGNRNTGLTLTVTSTPDFSLSLTQSSLSIQQGNNSPTTVNITRTNFTGAVTLSVTGAPTGVTTAFNPTAPTGNTSTLTVTVGASVTPGVYNLTVSGNGTPGTRNTPLTLTVTTSGGGSGNFTVDWSGCGVGQQPVFVAFQDGNGAFVKLTGTSNVYHGTITASYGALAYVTVSGSQALLIVFYQTSSFFTTIGNLFCTGTSTRTATGTVAGVTTGNFALVNFGGSTQFAFANGPVFFSGVLAGAQDLVAYEYPATGPAITDRMRFDRGLNPANGASVGTIDMTDAKSFAPAFVTNTVANAGTDMLTHGMNYYTGSCVASALYSGISFSGTTFTSYGAPPANQVSTDFHGVSITASTLGATNSFRTLQQDQHTLTAATYTLGSVLPIPTLSSLSAPYKRLQEAAAVPTEYNGSLGFTYTDAVSTNPVKTVSLQASAAWLAASGSSGLAAPDLSALSGFDSSWMPSSANQVSWSLTATNSNLIVSGCSEGLKFLTAARSGSF